MDTFNNFPSCSALLSRKCTATFLRSACYGEGPRRVNSYVDDEWLVEKPAQPSFIGSKRFGFLIFVLISFLPSKRSTSNSFTKTECMRLSYNHHHVRRILIKTQTLEHFLFKKIAVTSFAVVIPWTDDNHVNGKFIPPSILVSNISNVLLDKEMKNCRMGAS